MAVNYAIKGPKFRTANQLVADGTLPITQAALEAPAYSHSIGRKASRTYLFSDQDIANLYKALPCPSNSSTVQNLQTGSCAAPSGDKALKKALAHLT